MRTVELNDPGLPGDAEREIHLGDGSGAGKAITRRQRFSRACRCLPLDYPPVWMMRQAGRVLPEYRALKEKYTFLELVQTPELAAEVTLQPIQRFGFDAAIFFSDILVVPEALGQKYDFRDRGGVQMEFKLETEADIDRLETCDVREHLRYASDALPMIRRELGDGTALIGFAGSPWTLANFMLEGGSAKEFTRARVLFHTNRPLFNRLFKKLTIAVIEFLKLQIEAGVDAVQIFDSLGGMAAENIYNAASARWIREIIQQLDPRIPVIVFGRGVHGNWRSLADTGADMLSVDWTVNLAEVRRQLPEDVGVQGNLDPAILMTNPGVVAAETRRILTEMRGLNGHIFNLGHGVPPQAELGNIEAMVETIRNFKPTLIC